MVSKPEGVERLIIPSSEMNDGGIFRCEAKNPAGTARTEAPLNVLPADLSSLESSEIAPEFLSELKAVKAKEGEPAVFECQYSYFCLKILLNNFSLIVKGHR